MTDPSTADAANASGPESDEPESDEPESDEPESDAPVQVPVLSEDQFDHIAVARPVHRA